MRNGLVKGLATARVRCGRPRRELAGAVEERILDAAAKVFLERGFGGASVDEIAGVACAGKPTIYARFPNKQARFGAVMARMVQRNTNLENFRAARESGSTMEERLALVAAAVLRNALLPENVGLMRSVVAESRRFLDLAGAVHRMVRERGTEAVAKVLSELAQSDEAGALPSFAPDRLQATTRRFLDLILLPFVLRALFGEDLAALRAEAAAHISESVAFVLAACRQGDKGQAQRLHESSAGASGQMANSGP